MQAMTTLRRSARLANKATSLPGASTTRPLAKKSKKQKKTKSATHGHGIKKNAIPAKKKQKRSGLQGTVDSSAPLGVIDPESKITGSIVAIDGEPADAMLVLVDPVKNHDKFFVLQCIARTTSGDYCVYSRWGRTGTAGQALQQDFDDAEAAMKAFVDKFTEKTGLTWKDRQEPYLGNKYRFIVQDFAQKGAGYSNAKWQYFVDDGVDGKMEGWYDYDANGSRQVEMLFHQNAQNPQLSQRQVASGIFTYNVDLDNMTQTNVTHPARKSRRIRRLVLNQDDEDEEEQEEQEEEERTRPLASAAATTAPVGSSSPPSSAASAAAVVTPPRPRRQGTVPSGLSIS